MKYLSRSRWSRRRVEVALSFAHSQRSDGRRGPMPFTSFRAAAVRLSRARFLSGVVQQ